MKKISAILSFTALLFCGCTVTELNGGRLDSPVFTASFEEMPGTKTYVDSDLYMYWNADDRLSIFTTTYNQQYKFSGKTGDNGGDFEEVAAGGFHSGNTISTNYAVYPYSSTTSLSKDEKISLTMPAVQDYAEGSFGLGASTMVAVTAGPSDYFLAFKNLCGFLVVKLYGEGSVKSVSIKGNNGEKLAGPATVTASHGSAPTLAFGDDATETITIDCGSGVALGSDASHATEFWFCIPPVSFSKGFTITVTDTKGCSMEKSTSTSREVERNIKTSMAALPAVFESDNESGSLIDTKIPYICSSQTIKVPFEPFASFVVDYLNYSITYKMFLRDYVIDGSSAGGTQYSAVVYVKDPESGEMVDSKDKYADISFDSAFPPEYPITITVSHAQAGQIGDHRDLYIKFSDEYSKEEVWVPITISVAPPAIFDFGMNKIANEWFTEIDGERNNTVKVFVNVPSSTEDDVMDYSRDIDHYYIAYNPSISLSDYADDVYKALSEDGKTLKYASALQTRYEYSFSEIQPKVGEYQLGLRTGKDGKVTDYHNLYAFDSRGNELGLVASLVGETKHEKLVYSTSEIAKVILNMYPHDTRDQMQMVYANIHVDVFYGSCDILAGSEDFHARFLRPINIAWNSPEAVVAGSTGNANINVADFISEILDWNYMDVVRKATASDNVPEGQTLVENVIKGSINLYKYYQFESLVVDLKNVMRDNWATADPTKKGLVSGVTPAAKLTIGDKTNEPVEIDIKDIAKLNDVVVNYNLDEPFQGTFNLYFPVKVVYSWGEIDDIVRVTLQYDDSPVSQNIVFKDSAAKFACVVKFDKDGDGEVSIDEAEAATSFSGLFTDWKGVASFDEISYFKNVTSISGLFNGCTKLESITIPENITDLGTSAFSGCSSLTSVNLPSNITAIGNYTFQDCSKITSIDIPSKVTSIGSNAFNGCSSLGSAGLPANLTSIGSYAFQNCSKLASIDIPSRVTSLGSYVFDGCSSLTYVSLPNSLTSIGTHVFQNCTSLATVFLPSGITSIPERTFYNCKQLSEFAIPDGVTKIGDYAFYNCRLFRNGVSKIEIPASVTNIGTNNFTYVRCAIINSSSYVSISDRYAFGNYTKIYVAANKVEAYKVRTNWSSIAKRIFSINDYEDSFCPEGAVDLGLSVYWATCNIGATQPEEYGDYYAWGETETKTDYSWSTYFDSPNRDGNSFTKYYIGEGGKTVLDPEDDVAHVLLGGKFRIPTHAECVEMIQNCIDEKVMINGVWGELMTSRITGESIFLPRAGDWMGTSYYAKAGNYNCYWSSSLDSEDMDKAYYIQNYLGGDLISTYGWDRSFGLSVRPVSD